MEKKPNYIRMPLDLASITSSAKTSGIDISQGLNALSNFIHERYVAGQHMELDNAINEHDKKLYEFNSVFSDDSLYYDKDKLNNYKKQFEDFKASSKSKLSEFKISDELFNKTKNNFDKMSSNLDSKIKFTEEKHEAQQIIQNDYRIIAENTNQMNSDAFSGNFEFLDDNYNLVEEKYFSLAERGVISEVQRDEAISDTLGKTFVISSVSQQVKNIINNNSLSDKQKIQQLENFKKNFKSDEVVKINSKLAQDGTKLSVETTEMGIRKNLNIVDSLIARDLNKLNTKNKNKTSMKDIISELTIAEKDNYQDMLNEGDVLRADAYAYEKTGGILPFENRFDMLSNEQYTTENFGTIFKLTDKNDVQVPTNALPQEAITSVQRVFQDPVGYLGISEQEMSSLSENELNKLFYKKTVDIVKNYTGAKNDVAAVKILTGTNLNGGQVVAGNKVIDLNFNDLELGYSIVEDNFSKAQKLMLENKVLNNIGTISNAFNEINFIDNSDKNKIEKIQAYQNQGISLDKRLIEGKEIDPDDWIKKGWFGRERTFVSGEPAFDMLLSSVNKVGNELGLSGDEIENYKSEMLEIVSNNDLVRKTIYDYSFTIFNKEYLQNMNVTEKNKYLLEGITFEELSKNVKDTNGVSPVEKAMSLYLRRTNRINTLGEKEKIKKGYSGRGVYNGQ